MTRKSQTSDRISSLAGRYIKLRADDIPGADHYTLAADVRSMAASLLRQDETRGLRGMMRKVFGG